MLVCIHGLPVHFHATILGGSVSATRSVRPGFVVTPPYQRPGSDIGFWVLFGRLSERALCDSEAASTEEAPRLQPWSQVGAPASGPADRLEIVSA